MSVLPYTIYQTSRLSRSRRRGYVIPLTIASGLLILTFLTLGLNLDCIPASAIKEHDRPYPVHTNVVIRGDGKVFKYDRHSPVVFISGLIYSGGYALRDILNGHPDIRCTDEKHFIQKLLEKQNGWYFHKNESLRLAEAGVSQELMYAAIGSFSLEMMARSGPPVEYLCNEDFHSVKFGRELSKIFPRSKFLLVVRDPMHYAYERMLEPKPKNSNASYEGYLKEWEDETQHQRQVCNIILARSYMNVPRCKIVIFEQLFLHPASTVLQILEFISGNFSLHRIPHSMRSGLRPGVNDDLLDWVKYVPESVVRSASGMRLENYIRFGYSELGYPPNYHHMKWK